MNQLQNTDVSPGCDPHNTVDFDVVAAASELPEGFGFAVMEDPNWYSWWPLRQLNLPPGKARQIHFAYGLPDDTPDGVYDTCISVTNTKTGLRARQVCPNTCGCNDPKSPLALFNADSGCGDQCVRSGVYRAKLDEIPCEDVPKDDPDFVAFLEDFYAVSQTWPQDWAAGAWQWSHTFMELGCDALAGTTDSLPYQFGANPCVDHGWWFPIKPLSYFCPVACACYSGDPHCPTTCPARNETTHNCPDYQKKLANSYPLSTTCTLAPE